MRTLANFIIGLIFGLGLILAGMADPNKVLNFLDVAGSWDPSLALVMAAAIAVTAPGYWLARRRSAPLLDVAFHWPTAVSVDAPLLVGSAIFGLGWGLVGLCPGPALVALPLAAPAALTFAPAMALGIVLAKYARRALSAKSAGASAIENA